MFLLLPLLYQPDLNFRLMETTATQRREVTAISVSDRRQLMATPAGAEMYENKHYLTATQQSSEAISWWISIISLLLTK